MIPVVFFLLTVLSALCLFCKKTDKDVLAFKKSIRCSSLLLKTFFKNELKACFTHIVLYDLFNPGHSEDEDEWDQRGVAAGRRYIRDLLKRVKRGNP